MIHHSYLDSLSVSMIGTSPLEAPRYLRSQLQQGQSLFLFLLSPATLSTLYRTDQSIFYRPLKSSTLLFRLKTLRSRSPFNPLSSSTVEVRFPLLSLSSSLSLVSLLLITNRLSQSHAGHINHVSSSFSRKDSSRIPIN